MHSTLTRAQTAFGLFTTVALILSVLVCVSTFPSGETPTAAVRPKEVNVVRTRSARDYGGADRDFLHLTFDADIDLSSLYSWNTRQVFVYVKATYPPRVHKQGRMNEAIVWDGIFPSANAFAHENYQFPPAHYHGEAAPKSDSRRSAQSDRPGVVRLRNQLPKHWISDPSGRMALRPNVTLSVGYSVQPWIGPTLRMRGRSLGRWNALEGGVSEPFELPEAVKASSLVSQGLRLARGNEHNRGMPV